MESLFKTYTTNHVRSRTRLIGMTIYIEAYDTNTAQISLITKTVIILESEPPEPSLGSLKGS